MSKCEAGVLPFHSRRSTVTKGLLKTRAAAQKEKERKRTTAKTLAINDPGGKWLKIKSNIKTTHREAQYEACTPHTICQRSGIILMYI